MAEDNASAFFSFSTLDPSVVRDAPVIDDFISAHVQARDSATTVPPIGAQHAAVAAPLLADTCSSPLDQAKSVPRRPVAPAMLGDQVHPLIKSRRLDTPEEIAAWIAERKAKYPTNENIRLKAMQTSGGDNASHSSLGHASNKRKHNSVELTTAVSAPSSNPLSMLMSYAGESDADKSSDDDSSDDDKAPDLMSSKPPAVQAPFKPSGLAPGADRRKLRTCKYFAKDRCHRGNACPFAHSEPHKPRETLPPASAAEPSSAKGTQSLLEMLMAKDIDRENSRILQCIEYICDKNFLGVPAQYELLYQTKH